ncbi:hypothetical protein RDV64_09065 [Acuticoccus sp. MNP-M23]|uniref:hypothetical protein n=1 Tax=Acuticoccus sp. MNP-M23 TaxID=3072793 RepID=UPI002814FB05|nr:hypothetical protein [Acuticoccus sp. MNP-M23]WMS45166.1 hypothetical protein RDV64_03360 [Acuticoccus sp. MNP-M23]WMS45169.1 hypothetical protein RDV64_09065 [Acuticoccus sp. MNP-M23]
MMGVLGQTVLIREGGVERRVTAAEAFLLHLVKKGLDGEGASARQAMAAIEAARDKQLIDETSPITVIIRSFVTLGSVSDAGEILRISRKRDRFRETAHLVLEPWIVQAALDRF